MTALEALAQIYGSRLWDLSHEEREAVTRDLVALYTEEDFPTMALAARELDRRIGGYLESYSAVLAAGERRRNG